MLFNLHISLSCSVSPHCFFESCEYVGLVIEMSLFKFVPVLFLLAGLLPTVPLFVLSICLSRVEVSSIGEWMTIDPFEIGISESFPMLQLQSQTKYIAFFRKEDLKGFQHDPGVQINTLYWDN